MVVGGVKIVDCILFCDMLEAFALSMCVCAGQCICHGSVVQHPYTYWQCCRLIFASIIFCVADIDLEWAVSNISTKILFAVAVLEWALPNISAKILGGVKVLEWAL